MLGKSHEVKEEDCELLLIFYFLTQGGVYYLFIKQYNLLFYYVYQMLLNMIQVNIFSLFANRKTEIMWLSRSAEPELVLWIVLLIMNSDLLLTENKGMDLGEH